MRQGADRIFDDFRETVHGDKLVIPGIVVSQNGTRTRKYVVELTAQHEIPGVVQFRCGISCAT